MTTIPTSIWPADYNVSPDHCGDVLRGIYDVPFNPSAAPTVLDIGANVGAFSLWAANRWPGCKIHCYEPHPRNFELLCRTIKEHGLSEVTPNHCAVFNASGSAKLSEGPHNCGEHSLIFNYGTKLVDVSMVSALELPNADILKIDTEGCEWPILTAFSDAGRLRQFSAVMMETHGSSDCRRIEALMKTHGFCVTKRHEWHPERIELCYLRADLLEKPPVAPQLSASSKSSSSLWAPEFIAAGIAPDHCDDVLAGCYDVPLDFPPEKPPVILDLGANIGAFARWAVTRWPGCTLHCYEPEPSNFALLERTIANIAPEQSEIHAHPVAVFNESRRMVLHLGKSNCGAHSFYNLGESSEKTVEVEAVHACALPRADILKLDIEGAEMPVLLALHDIGRLREFSAIMLEYHSNVIALATKQLLADLGFTLTGEKLHEKHRGELRFVKTALLPERRASDLLTPPPACVPPPSSPPPPVSTHATKPKVFIATPAHDHKFHSGYVFSLLKLGRCGKFNLSLNRVAGCGVARARNNMAHEFLTQTDAEYYAAIDADIGFEPEHLERAIALNQPIVAVPYALKQDKLQWCMNALPGAVPDPATGFVKVSTAGTGFLVIKREVFEKMIAAYPSIAYDEDLPEAKGQTRWDFFSMGVVSRRYLTEDWFFCVRARELGYDIWMDALNHVKHEGLISYPIARQRAGMFDDIPAPATP